VAADESRASNMDRNSFEAATAKIESRNELTFDSSVLCSSLTVFWMASTRKEPGIEWCDVHSRRECCRDHGSLSPVGPILDSSKDSGLMLGIPLFVKGVG